MDRKEIEDKVKEILAKELNIKKENITPEKRLIEDLGMDSFKAIEIIFEIEDSFGKRIKDSEIKDIKTVRDIIQRLEDSRS
jgi:acyl carrier protein